MNDLALLMSGNMDLLSGATNQSAQSIVEQAKRAEEQMTIMEDLKALMFEVAEVFIRFEDEIKSATSFLKEYIHEEKGFGIEVEILSKFLSTNKVVQELPINYNARGYAEGKKIKINDGINIFIKILKYRKNRKL